MTSPTGLTYVCLCLAACSAVIEATLYTPYVGSSLHRNDDGYSGAQSMGVNFKFFGTVQSTLYVSTISLLK